VSTNETPGEWAGLGMSDKINVIAIDIGGGTTKLALVDRRGAIRNWQSFPTAAPSAADFIDKVVAAGCQLRAEAGEPVAGISVAVAGFVDAEGVLEYNSNLPWLEGTAISALLTERLCLPVHVDADSNAACVAEYIFGQGRGTDRFLCLTGGTGLGVGMMAEGKLLRIAHGCLGDAGHIIIVPNGPACTCGGHGCAEALLSTASLALRYAQICRQPENDFRALVENSERGDPQARGLLQEAGKWLGVAAASLANIFLPDRIVIAGGLSQAGDSLFASALESFCAHGGRFPLARASLLRATTGEHATLLGAAACFFYPELL